MEFSTLLFYLYRDTKDRNVLVSSTKMLNPTPMLNAGISLESKKSEHF